MGAAMPQQDHPNATAYREAADAFRAGDLDRVGRLVDPDVVWHIPGSHSRAGDVRGRDAVVTFLAGLAPLGFWLREHDVLGNDEHVCALSLMGARRPGVDVETRVVSIFHFRDGRQLERWFFPEDAAAWDKILD
jgi:ketosteroid isomerase-like protein